MSLTMRSTRSPMTSGWALMLLMFVVRMGNVGWMLAIGAVMAAEKNLSWGRRLSAPLGIALIGWAGAIVAGNV